MRKISKGLSALFLFDQAVGLKNKIGQEMRQVKGQQRPEEVLHDFVQFLEFVRFCTTSQKCAR